MGYDLQLFSRLPASLDLDLAAPRGGILLVLREPIPETPDFHLGAQDAPPQELRVGGLAASIGMLGDWVGATGLQGPLQAAAQGTATFVGQQGVGGSVAESVPTSVAPAITGEWDPNTWRGPGTQPTERYAHGSPAPADRVGIACGWHYGAPRKPAARERWQDAMHSSSAARAPHVYLSRTRIGSGIVWVDGTSVGARAWSAYVAAYRRHTARGAAWVEGSPVRLLWGAPWVRLWPRHRGYEHAHDEATRTCRVWTCPSAYGRKLPGLLAKYWAPWEEAMRPRFIWPPPEPPEPPVEPPFVPDLDLVLGCRLPVPLWGPVAFDLWIDTCDRARHAGLEIPTHRRVILVVHTLTITTMPDGTPIPCAALEITSDRDSWCWRWRATVIGAATELAEQQREVLISIDGLSWSGIVESASMTRRHGAATTTVGGRSLSAQLSTPYVDPRSRLETTDRTAVQLAEDELYNTGWTLDWQTVDWLVPGGIFSYDRLTPIGALVRIAQAVGACVRSHTQQQTLTVYPRYPVPSWDLSSATPDVTIPGDIILELGTEWRSEALRRGVWVAGKTSGVSVRVYRSGTDGAPYAQMVVDDLITHIDAARERGRQILSAGGKRADVRLSMPLTTDTGLILPGHIVDVTDPAMRGYADAVAINAFSARVIQAVTIERVDETP